MQFKKMNILHKYVLYGIQPRIKSVAVILPTSFAVNFQGNVPLFNLFQYNQS